jgi:hypothetical protein
MSLAAAFTTAWKDLKSETAKLATLLTKDQTKIQADVAEGSTIVKDLVPAAAPIVTIFDEAEEAIMGELASIAANPVTLASLATAAPGLANTLTTVTGLLSNHPAVVAAKAAA